MVAAGAAADAPGQRDFTDNVMMADIRPSALAEMILAETLVVDTMVTGALLVTMDPTAG
jgi:hypothetical protein